MGRRTSLLIDTTLKRRSGLFQDAYVDDQYLECVETIKYEKISVSSLSILLNQSTASQCVSRLKNRACSSISLGKLTRRYI
ncbi:hypothetical protein MESS2_1230004 [Mesorhizobium metallidurans STM 2683]|uniref:Uncharacterized protein n=1 Tax=Mesorhizobium metallidurans STM 2683 TaxID=1297569 RepID=M5EJC3_9HYPH|nr:hypothetical protein MESS2_1230004 [Mesorhizobium metallidurans STM 2683]